MANRIISIRYDDTPYLKKALRLYKAKNDIEDHDEALEELLEKQDPESVQQAKDQVEISGGSSG